MTSRSAAQLILALNLAFVVLVALAIWLYPGGTWLHPHRPGHAWWENFLCDLLHSQSLSGHANHTGSRLAQAGMLAEAAALCCAWLKMPALFPTRITAARWVRGMGMLSALGTLGVVLLPSDRFGALHGIAVLFASLPAFVAASITVATLLPNPKLRLSGTLGAAALALSIVSFVLYARTQFFGVALSLVVPASQRIATLLVVLFCCSLALDLLQLERSAERSLAGPRRHVP